MDASECLTEQEDEHEALESMFLEDEFKILVPLNSSGSDAEPSVELTLVPLPGETDKNHVALKLIVSYPKMYPEVVPKLIVESAKGLNSDQIKDIRGILSDLAEENVGMPMVFTLAEAAKEWMQDRNEVSKGDGSAFERMQQRKRKVEREKEKEKEKIEQREHRKMEKIRKENEATRQILITMTEEDFYKWRAAFEDELSAKEEESKAPTERNVEKKVMTGRKIFEMGLAKGGAAAVRAAEAEMQIEEEESTKVADDGGETTGDAVVDASLFAGDDDLDGVVGDLLGDVDGLLDDF
eukprot:g4407.t1